MKKKALSLTLALVMCLGITVPAFAADSGIRVVNTGIQADRVANYDGYGSLKIDCKGSVFDDTFEYASQSALIDKNGTFVFPYKDTRKQYYVSDGIISLTEPNAYNWDWGSSDEGQPPAFYTMNGSPAFTLTFRDDIRAVYSGPIINGYTLFIELADGAPFDLSQAYIVDHGGNITCTLPEEYISLSSFGEGPNDEGGFSGGFSTEKSLGWCGEGLFAFYSHTVDDETYNFFSEVLGYMDPTGKTVIDLQGRGYISAWPFHEGLAAVKNQENKIGFIDKTGKLVIPCIYDRVNDFCDGLCGVVKDGKCGYIDRGGNTVIPLIYDDVYGAGNSLAAVVKDGKCGLVDYHNNIVVPLEYDDISSYHGGIAYGIKDGTVHLISGYHAGVQAMPTNDKLTRDGEPQDPTVYKIGDSNYFKVRDLAAILNGTGKQFSVGYDSEKQSVTVTTGEAYTMTGTELKGSASSNETAQISNDAIYVNGQKVEAEVYKIGGNNYFKLRDLGKALDFYVGWSKGEGMYIESGRSYTDTD